MSDGPTTESGVNLQPVLPTFAEANLPSAKQRGLLILVRRSDGSDSLAYSANGIWNYVENEP